MNDMFKKTLVACAAASVFGGSVYLGDHLLKSYINSAVVAKTIVDANEQSASNQTQEAEAAPLKPKANFSFSFGK